MVIVPPVTGRRSVYGNKAAMLSAMVVAAVENTPISDMIVICANPRTIVPPPVSVLSARLTGTWVNIKYGCGVPVGTSLFGQPIVRAGESVASRCPSAFEMAVSVIIYGPRLHVS